MKKILTIITCLMIVACGAKSNNASTDNASTDNTANENIDNDIATKEVKVVKSIKINGNFADLDIVQPNNEVQLKLSGEKEALFTTTLDENKCFTAEITINGEQFVTVYIDSKPIVEVITEEKNITFYYSAKSESIEYQGVCLSSRMSDINNELGERINRLYSATDETTEEALYNDFITYIENSIIENRDNIISLRILKYYMYYGEDDARFAELFAMVDKKHRENALYKEYQQHIKNTKNTTIGADLVDITLKDGNGNNVSVSQLCQSGKWVLVDFWATWCTPCRGEIPHLVDAYAEFAPKGLEIYGISFDRKGNEAKWQKFIEENNMSWVNVWGTDDKGSWAAGEAYNVSSIPTNFLFSPEGKLIAKNLRGEEIKTILAEHIK